MADNYKNFETSGPSNELIPKDTNYRIYDAYLSRYRFSRIPLNNVTGTTVNIGLNSVNLMEWKLPAKTIFNLAQSFISYQYVIPASAGNYSVSFENNQDLCNWIYFGDGGGLGICDLFN